MSCRDVRTSTNHLVTFHKGVRFGVFFFFVSVFMFFVHVVLFLVAFCTAVRRIGGALGFEPRSRVPQTMFPLHHAPWMGTGRGTRIRTVLQGSDAIRYTMLSEFPVKQRWHSGCPTQVHLFRRSVNPAFTEVPFCHFRVLTVSSCSSSQKTYYRLPYNKLPGQMFIHGYHECFILVHALSNKKTPEQVISPICWL